MNRLAGLAALAAALVTLPSIGFEPPRALVWNLTPSVPTGLYRIVGPAALRVGERVAIEPPGALRRLLTARGYLAPSMPLLKRVAALGGQRVCRTGILITIDGRPAARALARDRGGRPLPMWSGCHVLAANDVFVMNPAQPSSFDGRYFGVLARRHVTGRAVAVWTDEHGTGAHTWFAPHQR